MLYHIQNVNKKFDSYSIFIQIMDMNIPSPEEIKAWLSESGHDRYWLADQIGAKKSSLDQWFSKGFPDWATKNIARLMNPTPDNSAGLEVQFTHSEWMEIQAAMSILGYKIHKDFYHDVLIDGAREILSNDAAKNDSSLPIIAEEGKLYKTKRKSA